ncbi:MAG: GNAT family N-acetyltransferase [Xanthobacteraceae bacterium]
MHDEVRLRPYRTDDVEPTIVLWRSAWRAAMPEVDFDARLDWWRKRWVEELVPANTIVVAERHGSVAGFVVIDPATGWLDQMVVEPEKWGSGIAEKLIDEAKRISPASIRLDVNQSNARAIRFYERVGFVRTGSGANANSGAATFLYEWNP